MSHNLFVFLWIGVSLIIIWVNQFHVDVSLWYKKCITAAVGIHNCYIWISIGLHPRAMGAHSPLLYCIAEDSLGIPIRCTEHRDIKDVTVLCPTSSVSGLHIQYTHSLSPPFVYVLWALTLRHSGVHREGRVYLSHVNESFHQFAWPCSNKNVFLTEEYGLGITMTTNKRIPTECENMYECVLPACTVYALVFVLYICRNVWLCALLLHLCVY